MSWCRGSRIGPYRRTEAEALALLDSEDFIDVADSEDRVEIIEEEARETGQEYLVLWAKPSAKKRTTWEGDGRLRVSNGVATLLDEDGRTLGTASAPPPSSLLEGSVLFVGSKKVEVIELAKGGDEGPVAKKRKIVPAPVSVPVSLGTRNFRAPDSGERLVLPPPPSEHQWTFNAHKRPVNDVVVNPFLSGPLRLHQREGLVFMYECVMGYRRPDRTGAILADEMGLGKTLQCIALIWTLLKHGPYGVAIAKRALVVAPSTLCVTWQREFLKWLGRERLQPFVVGNAVKPNDFAAQRLSPVMIISYERLAKHADDVEKIPFDLIVCDEAHRLKNSNIKTAQAFERLSCKRRVLLTGTPFQNDFQEYFVLVDVANPGALGTYSEFRQTYQEPILRSQTPDCGEEDRLLGAERSERLKSITSAFILRRTQNVLDDLLPTKTEYVICCRLTEFQRNMYASVLREYYGTSHFTPLSLITMLKKICNHPSLSNATDEAQNEENCDKFNSIRQFRNEIDSQSSGKLIVLEELLKIMVIENKEKVVVVSCSTKMLDVIEERCKSINIINLRLDGNTPMQQRQSIIDRFNSKLDAPGALLLSSRAGGVGLSLPGASRLVLYDSDWNPAVDAQAMARIWREGQKRPVHVYRFVSTGTIEEKIYHRQIYKTGLSDIVLQSKTAKSNTKLSDEDLKDLFSMDFDSESTTHDMIQCPCDEEDPQSERFDEDDEYDKINGKDVSNSNINNLKKWEHFREPFDSGFLKEIGVDNSLDLVSFVFRKTFKKID